MQTLFAFAGFIFIIGILFCLMGGKSRNRLDPAVRVWYSRLSRWSGGSGYAAVPELLLLVLLSDNKGYLRCDLSLPTALWNKLGNKAIASRGWRASWEARKLQKRVREVAARGPTAKNVIAVGDLLQAIYETSPLGRSVLRELAGSKEGWLAEIGPRLARILIPPNLPVVVREAIEVGNVVDLTGPALDGDFEGYTLRSQVRQVAEIIGSRPVALLGPKGVGKTFTAKLLARELLFPGSSFADWCVLEIVNITQDAIELFMAAANKPIIIFVDEARRLLDSPWLLDALKAPVADGRLSLVLATTSQEWSQICHLSPAWADRFFRVEVSEPSRDEMLKILKNQWLAADLPYNETVEAIMVRLYSLAELWVPRQRADPRRCCYILDVMLGLLKKDALDYSQALCQAISLASTCPDLITPQIVAGDKESINRMVDDLWWHLSRSIEGQDLAREVVVDGVRVFINGLKDVRRPVEVALFLGPTGVGKTETARALAEFLYGRKLILFSMGEFQEAHTIARFIGSPPGYVGYEDGGELVKALQDNPYSVVVFDEIEKAHSDVWDLLLGLFEDGFITDGRGERADASKAIFVMTGNIPIPAGLNDGDARAWLVDEGWFRPEFVNRITHVVIFGALTQENIRQIIRRCWQVIFSQICQHKDWKSVDFTPATLEALACQWDSNSGARSIIRLINSRVMRALASANLVAGSSVTVDYNSSEFVAAAKR